MPDTSLTTPTWQFVKEVVSENINKADAAYLVARDALQALADQYRSLVQDRVTPTIHAGALIDWPNTITPPAQPVEPDYSGEAPDPVTVYDINKPGGIAVPGSPGYAVDLSGQPGVLPDMGTIEVPLLDPLPLIDVPIPTLDIQTLHTTFSFAEPVYTERVSPLVRAGIERVLSGDMGIPQAYWEAIWTEAANDLAKQQVGALRNARNRGAASYWGLPTEAVLAASRAIQDETTRNLSKARLEQAKQQAVFAREDFWQGVQQGIAYEQQWLAFHEQVANRALAAAEQAVKLAIEIQNAIIQQHNLRLEAAKITGELANTKIQSAMSRNAQLIQIMNAKLQLEEFKIKRFQAEWQGYQIDKTTHIQSAAERIKWWNGLVDADARYEQLQLQKSDTDLKKYAAVLSKVETIARATGTLLQARTGVQAFDLDKQKAAIALDQTKNATTLDIAKMVQEAQKLTAQLEISQAEWIGGQGAELMKAIATHATGMYQALLTVSDVNLSSGWSGSSSTSVSASRNAELLW